MLRLACKDLGPFQAPPPCKGFLQVEHLSHIMMDTHGSLHRIVLVSNKLGLYEEKVLWHTLKT